MPLLTQVVWLLVLAVPVACVAWTVTHEEIFHEAHEYFVQRAQRDRGVLARKFFYALTCEYCFSHYVALAAVFITRFWMLYPDWRGYGIAWFSLVWVANIYIGIFGKVKLTVKKERAEIKKIEKEAA